MKPSVLFVCLGNICRSPLAEGVFRAELERRGWTDLVDVDSCGTGGWHVGESPDPRSVDVALEHDVDISAQRSRQLHRDDYGRFDWVVAMDRDNERVILQRQPSGASCRVVRMLSYHPSSTLEDVPDPYYGGVRGFDTVYELLVASASALLDAVMEGRESR
jgi:protein-tyrosine phosphatase